MEDSKITFKTHYIGKTVKFTAEFTSPLSRKEIKDLKNVFLLPYTEKLAQYKNAIDTFIRNHRKFIRMLQKSETKYRHLPFEGEDKEYKRYLDAKGVVIKKQLNEYTIKKELEDMEPLTELTEFEKKNITRSRKRALISEQSEIQKEYQRNKASTDEYNRSLKRNFINSQWKEYNRFFAQNPAFRKVLNQLIQSHLQEEYSIEIDELSDYSIKEDLVLIIRDLKKINKKLRERSINFRKELSSRIERWENESEQKFFPSIFTNSEFGLRVNKSSLELTFDVKLMYENIMDFMYSYYDLELPQTELLISKDKYVYLIAIFLL